MPSTAPRDSGPRPSSNAPLFPCPLLSHQVTPPGGGSLGNAQARRQRLPPPSGCPGAQVTPTRDRLLHTRPPSTPLLVVREATAPKVRWHRAPGWLWARTPSSPSTTQRSPRTPAPGPEPSVKLPSSGTRACFPFRKVRRGNATSHTPMQPPLRGNVRRMVSDPCSSSGCHVVCACACVLCILRSVSIYGRVCLYLRACVRHVHVTSRTHKRSASQPVWLLPDTPLELRTLARPC